MSGRTTKIILALSLALNVFIIGGVAGGAFMWKRAGAGEREVRGLAVAARLLDQDQRNAFRKALRAARTEARPDQDAGRASREELQRLLGQSTLDRVAIDTTLGATRTADLNVRGRIESAVVDFAAGLSVEDRAKLVDGLGWRSQMLRGTGK